MHWATQYIGKKWRNGGRGPFEFDCWGLLRWVYFVHLGIELPAFPGLDAKDCKAVFAVITEETSGKPEKHWTEIDKPIDCCAVLIGRSHVGIFLDVDGGTVLHAADGQDVRAHSLSRLVRIHPLRFYRWQPLSK